MRAEDIMTPEPIRVTAESTVTEALALLALADVRHIPVVDGAKVVGMLSERDLLGLLADSDERDAQHPTGENQKVSELMSGEVIGVELDASIRAVIDLFLETRVGAVLVLKEGHLEGIISYMDVLEALREHAPE
jgi:CBS domain-containing protein